MESISNFTIHNNMSTNVNFKDGSTIFLSSCGSSYIFLNDSISTLSSVYWRQTRFATSDIKSKVIFVLKLRNMFTEDPYLPFEFLNASSIITFPQKICDYTLNKNIDVSCAIEKKGYYILRSNSPYFYIILIPNSNFVLIQSMVELITYNSVKYDYCLLTQCFSIDCLPMRWTPFVNLLLEYKSSLNPQNVALHNPSSFNFNIFESLNKDLLFLNDSYKLDKEGIESSKVIHKFLNELLKLTLMKSLPLNCGSKHLHTVIDLQQDAFLNVKVYIMNRVLYILSSNNKNIDVLFPDLSSMFLLENFSNVFRHILNDGLESFYSINYPPIEETKEYSINTAIFIASKLLNSTHLSINTHKENVNNCLNRYKSVITNTTRISNNNNEIYNPDMVIHNSTENNADDCPNIERELLHLKCFNFVLQNSTINEPSPDVSLTKNMSRKTNQNSIEHELNNSHMKLCKRKSFDANFSAPFTHFHDIASLEDAVSEVLDSTKNCLTRIDHLQLDHAYKK